ncbi:MAG: ComF family protein [Desulfuromonadaceae bacterium]|nr:ComF family protein [Desulfuromonadaceae bacterium]
MKLFRALKKELSGLVDFIFPPVCPLCGKGSVDVAGVSFCRNCLADFSPLVSPFCTLCALPFVGPQESDHYCGACITNPPPFSSVTSFGIYEGLLKEAVQTFKYRDKFHLGRPLGRLVAEKVAERHRFCPFDLILPVPLHRRRLQERTYNQALLLAETIGRHLAVPVNSALLRRLRPTPPQQGLSERERLRNLKGVFGLAEKIEGLRVLLVDDVMTTGATARECSQVLLRGGASGVEVAVVARAARHF